MMQIPAFRNPAWADQAQTIINVEINHQIYGWIPFTANPSDKGAQFDVPGLIDRIKAEGNIGAYVATFGP